MKKILKGFFGLFVLKGLFILSFLTVQSCNDNNITEPEGSNTNEKKEAFNTFKTAIKGNASTYESELKKLIDEGEQTIQLKSIITQCDTLLDNTLTPEEQLAINFEDGIHDEAINVLYSYGFTDVEIIQEFGSMDSPEISIVANLAVSFEDKLDENLQVDFLDESDFELAGILGVSNAYAQQGSDTVGGCIADAIGITAVFTLISDGASKQLTKYAIKKLIRKVATRSLGAVGAALAVYDFVDCMGWI